jgi:dihydroorotate dehydrogenase
VYKFLLRPLLFLLSPEKAHHFTFSALKFSLRLPGTRFLFRLFYQINDKRLEKVVFGIKFPNPVGLGAGLDKDAILTDELAELGFGFVEIGTLTPKAQPGNDQPRLFRLK